MNDARKKFLETFAVQVKGISDTKWAKENEQRKPPIGGYANGYKKYILDLGEEFIHFAEVYNKCIGVAKYNEIVGNTELKVRIKDFSSSLSNTEHKILDDVFGMQISTKTEEDKEIFVLFNYLLFEIQKSKRYNKPNGYIADHHIGKLSLENIEDIKKTIKKILTDSKIREYKKATYNPVYDKDKMKDVFKVLPRTISNSSKFNRIAETLKEMLKLMQDEELDNSKIPLIEFHFMTFDVEENAIRGTASHAKYKSKQAKLVKQFFNNGRLLRGINAPWKFVGKKNGLVLEDFYTTILENWPFLINDIVERRKAGKEQADIRNNAKSDLLLASQFPFLKGYLKNKTGEYSENEQAEQWGMLKALMITNRIDFNKDFETIEEALMENIGEIWK